MADPREVLRQFQYFDVNGDNSIDRGELANVLKQLDAETWTSSRIDQLLATADVNSDGRIDLQEFIDYVFSEPPHASSLREAPFDSKLVWDEFRAAIRKLPDPGKGLRPLADQASAMAPSRAPAAARLQQMREQFQLPKLPGGLDGRMSMHHMRTHAMSGEVELKLTRLVPEGDGGILLTLAEVTQFCERIYLYRLRNNKLTVAGEDEASESFRASEERAPREIKLLCALSLSTGGGEKCSTQFAQTALAEAARKGHVESRDVDALMDSIKKDDIMYLLGKVADEAGASEEQKRDILAECEERTIAELEAEIEDLSMYAEYYGGPERDINRWVTSLMEIAEARGDGR